MIHKVKFQPNIKINLEDLKSIGLSIGKVYDVINYNNNGKYEVVLITDDNGVRRWRYLNKVFGSNVVYFVEFNIKEYRNELINDILEL